MRVKYGECTLYFYWFYDCIFSLFSLYFYLVQSKASHDYNHFTAADIMLSEVVDPSSGSEVVRVAFMVNYEFFTSIVSVPFF